MATPIFDINFKSMEAEKDISKDKHKLMTAKMGDSVSIKKRKRGSRGNVYKRHWHDWIKYGCTLVQKPIFILIILNLNINFNFLKNIWYTNIFCESLA